MAWLGLLPTPPILPVCGLAGAWTHTPYITSMWPGWGLNPHTLYYQLDALLTQTGQKYWCKWTKSQPSCYKFYKTKKIPVYFFDFITVIIYRQISDKNQLPVLKCSNCDLGNWIKCKTMIITWDTFWKGHKTTLLSVPDGL